MIGGISGKIKAKAALVDPTATAARTRPRPAAGSGRSTRSCCCWSAVLIAIGLIAVAAASPAAGQRYSGGSVQFSELYYFWRQIVWIAVGVPVMIVHLDDEPRARQAPVARRRGLLLRPAGLRSVPRARDERRDALDRHRHRPAAAVGVPEALLRGRHGLAAEPARAGQVAAGVLGFGGGHRCGRRPVDEAARFRLDDHLLLRVAGDAGARRYQPADARNPRRGGARRRRPRLFLLRRRDRRASTASCSARATISRSRMRCAR